MGGGGGFINKNPSTYIIPLPHKCHAFFMNHELSIMYKKILNQYPIFNTRPSVISTRLVEATAKRAK